MTEQRRIVIVDDDTAVRETFAEVLALHGFSVEALPGAAAMRARVTEGTPFDVALLDVTMPGEDGLSLARWLRSTTRVGIIMVTARGETIDRIVGLEVGADDYVAKPVEPRELVARIRALLRRLDDRVTVSPEAPGGKMLRVGRMALDPEARTLTDIDGRAVMLTAMEFDLLLAMATRPGRVLSREVLLDLAHKDPDEPFDRSIDIRIARLRRKIERDPARPEIIKTVRGVGYVFVREPG